MQSTQLGLITLILSFALSSLARSEPAQDFSALLDEVWEWQLAENPMFASQLGDRRYNDRWSDMSLEAIAQRQQQQRVFMRRLLAIDPATLRAAEQLNYDLFRRADAVKQLQMLNEQLEELGAGAR